ncbi:MAG: asparagine synthase, glutamine-hydrolyzing [Acidimicrobiales bacterium]|nr:asparagine synthase, glutamine-hydrolyzing [Acidimicrobiales bacterium]
MTVPASHRGPDADGCWSDAERGVALAHRRLAIVGLGEGGAQPMVSADGRWVLTYNGEIYNAAEIGAKLEASGVRFRGTSDTEILLEALAHWGRDEALAAISGMFAFAAWDRQDRRLLLARDRMGEKPLAYGRIGSRFVFASEVRSLAAVPGFSPEPDPEALALFLRYKYVPAPWTIYPGIAKLPPGTSVVVDGASLEVGPVTPYWSLAEIVEAGARDPLPDEPATLDLLDRTIAASVRSQLRADVPLGAFLSGGIDSTLIATHAAEQLDRPLKTFTIGSDDPELDESSQARVIAGRLGAEHTELMVTPADALAEVPELAGIYDEPFADSSQLPTLLVSRLARRDVTVVLSGDGGDELFGGYNRHVWLPPVWAKASRLPPGARRLAGRALLAPDPATWDRAGKLLPASRRPRMLGLKAAKVGALLASDDLPAAYLRTVSHWDPAVITPGITEPDALAARPGAWPELDDPAARLMAIDALTYLPDDVLVKVDRATMAVSLEGRVPFLAPEVVACAARLPSSYRVRDGAGKWALRQLLLRRYPADLVERPKSGFGVPIGSWLRAELRPWAEELLSPTALADAPFLDPAPVRQAWKAHLAGTHDHTYELWDVLMLQSWLARRPGLPVAA